MGVSLVPRSQDLRNERLKVESCNILFETLPTILMKMVEGEMKSMR